jgi:hypothetical protein
MLGGEIRKFLGMCKEMRVLVLDVPDNAARLIIGELGTDMDYEFMPKLERLELREGLSSPLLDMGAVRELRPTLDIVRFTSIMERPVSEEGGLHGDRLQIECRC